MEWRLAMHRHFERRFEHHGPRHGPEPGPERWERRLQRRRWFDWPGGPEHGPGRRERMERGVLRYLILDALADGPKHGYEVIKRLEERTEGEYAPSPGTVYPTLQLLEDQGFVRAEQAAERRVYALTEAGRAELAAHAELVAATLGRFGGRGRPRADLHEVTFLRDELHDLTRTVGGGLRAAMESGDAAKLRRMRQALERCQEEIRDIIAGAGDPPTAEAPAAESDRPRSEDAPDRA
jgi:DNA-binding PadR family transcriptional regulator